ncbi:MAG TPA: general secretion pathway protein GspB [Noviherbaspirillum sp.]|nr:general secretion pathway protein GspB [Noviherbaspirillum sp.]
MSYILEALKKAEAERRGGTQHAAPLLPPIAAAAGQKPAWRRPLPWAAFAALGVTLACAGWFAVTRTDAPTPRVAATTPAPAIAAVPPVVPREKPSMPEALEDAAEKPKAKTPPKKTVERKRSGPNEEPKTAKTTAPDAPVGTLHDLPTHIQGEIPSLSIGGYIYSGNKADRSVLINKRLLREGDEVAPGLVLEKMTPSGMVFNYKGYRYRRGY